MRRRGRKTQFYGLISRNGEKAEWGNECLLLQALEWGVILFFLLGVDSNLERLEDLDLNLGSKLLLLGGTRVGDTLSLGKVVTDGLGAELLDGEGLDSVDVERRVGVHGNETSRD